MKNIQKKDLENLFEHISSIYVGDYATVSRDLNRAVYYLHYLEKEMIPTHEVQDTCFALHQLGEYFYWAQSERRLREHDQYTKKLEKIKAILEEGSVFSNCLKNSSSTLEKGTVARLHG